jgi:hypothetical protein
MKCRVSFMRSKLMDWLSSGSGYKLEPGAARSEYQL